MPATAPRPVIDTVADAARAFASLVAGRVERAAVLYLDPERRLLGRADFAGSRDAVAPPLRAVIAGAMAHDAAALILGHSHVGADARPSAADIAYSRSLVRLCRPLELDLLDHLILADGAISSMRADGLM